jgi:hypothetical protein
MAFNPAAVDLPSFAALKFGILVERAAAALPQTAAAAIFTVATGRVALIGLVGKVTTVIQTQADNTKVKTVPTTGPTTDMCAVLDITAKAVGSLLGITGIPTDALQYASFAPFPQRALIIQPGSISLDCAASNTGAIAWSAWYLPLDDGATLVAA